MQPDSRTDTMAWSPYFIYNYLKGLHPVPDSLAK